MPKLKTNKSAAKRIKVTGSGKIKRAKTHRRHLLTSRTRKRKRHLRSSAILGKADHDRISLLIPNSF